MQHTQKTDVIIAVVGDAHRDGNKYKEYGYDKINSVPDLLREKGYTVLDYDATKAVHLNIATDVVKELDKQKVNTSQFAEVKQTHARKFVSFLKPLFCCFGRC